MKGPGADEHYWQALEQGRLELQQCNGCGRWNWPAVWRCGECGSWEHAWHEVPLKGRIFTWTRTWHDFGAPRDFTIPFVTVVVELEGAGHRRLLGTLAVAAEDKIRIGAEVNGEIIHVTSLSGESLPALRWHLAPGHTSAEAAA